jgi:aminoglycoside phosphotransferase (APT) family kinase protein
MAAGHQAAVRDAAMIEDLPGLPAVRVREWLSHALPDLFPDGDAWRAEVISGGLSNITYRLHLAQGTVILRRPPLGILLPSAHDMRREFRVLDALTRTEVPVPRPLAICTDHDVLGADFYLMTDVPGVVLRSEGDSARLTAENRRTAAIHLIQTLADLHSIEPDQIGLRGHGRPDNYCARQIRRWADQWQRSKSRDLPDMDRLLRGLTNATPADVPGVIVHGDYRLDNTLIDPGTGRLNAVLDWELSTIGDPLADLATMLTYWHDRGDAERARIPVSAGITALDGFPLTHELAEAYASVTGRDLGEFSFYLSLGSMKLAVILEGVHARFLAGQTVGTGYAQAGRAVPLLVSRALRYLRDRQEDPSPGILIEET